MDIGNKLKDRRKELQLTMLEVAQKVGVSEATVSRWESGDIANMRRDKIVSLAYALEVSPDYIMGWDIKEHKNNSEIFVSSSDKNILNKYNKLNSTGQTKAESYIDGLLENPSYVKKEKNSTSHNSDDFVLDESILGTDYNLVANVGISEPPKVKKKGTHT